MSVFHLKYRPQKLSDLDLADVADRLRKYLSVKEIPQSFLFAGPKGAGKTSAARILARLINCEDKIEGEACGVCDNCKDILSGRSMDIIEMDAASNRGIEDVRSLKEKAYLSPTKLKYKVFIIDEVHMLTKDAFNALLKLIEEPPKHTIFILCTTDAEKIPDTVLSRLIRVDFRKGGREELKRSLEKIITGEEVRITTEAIDFILDKSDGSFRNLQRSFNELVLSLGKELSLNQIEDFYSKRSGSYSEEDFENDLIGKEIKKILGKLEKMADDGVDFVVFRENLLVYFQKKLLAYFNVGNEKVKMDLKALESWINLLIRAAKQEKETEIDQLPMELAVIDFLGDIEDKNCNPKEIEKQKETEDLKKNDKLDGVKVVTIDVAGLNIDKVMESWGNILMTVKPFNHSVEAFLRASRPVELDGRKLVLEVFYPFHKDRLEEARNRKIVEEGLLKVLGVELAFECVLGKSKKEPLIIHNDTPMESVSEKLADEEKKEDKKDLYDVAKDIFG
ncbi:MAG: DNA polymerase III subunit gamma/tau [Candidatus Shapirobacteria bacterium]|nr:DNA polymerase III subunit gamma/tau [Candidatus Shapirobacteria bacterium]